MHPHPASLVSPLSSPLRVQPQADVDGRFGREVEPSEVDRGSGELISLGEANAE
jgi:hypothetical protein